EDPGVHHFAIHDLAKLISRGKKFPQFLFEIGGSNGRVKGRADLKSILPFARHSKLGLESQLVPASLGAAFQVVEKLIGAEIATSQRQLLQEHRRIGFHFRVLQNSQGFPRLHRISFANQNLAHLAVNLTAQRRSLARLQEEISRHFERQRRDKEHERNARDNCLLYSSESQMHTLSPPACEPRAHPMPRAHHITS